MESGIFQNPAGRVESGQEVLETSRGKSGRVRRFNITGSGRVTLTRSDSREGTRHVKSPGNMSNYSQNNAFTTGKPF